MKIRRLLSVLFLLALVCAADARKSFLKKFLRLFYTVPDYGTDYYSKQGYTCPGSSLLSRGSCFVFRSEMSYYSSRSYFASRNLKLAYLWKYSYRRKIRKYCETNSCGKYIFITLMEWNMRKKIERELLVRYKNGYMVCMKVSNGRLYTLPTYTKVQFLTYQKSCRKNRWLCADQSQCIKKKYLCNGRRNCRDGSDEANCDDCSKTFTADTGLILSPNYPKNYPSNANCEWKLDIKTSDKIKIKINSWSVEYYSRDRLIIKGGEKSWYFYGQTRAMGRQITIADNYVVIQFKTDHSGRRKGFNITYEAFNVSSSGQVVVTSAARDTITTGFTYGFTRSWTYTSISSVISYHITNLYMDSSCVIYIYFGTSSAGFLLGSYTGSTTFGFTGLICYVTHIYVHLICGSTFTLNPSKFRFTHQVSNDTTTTIDSKEYGSVVSPKGNNDFYPSNANCKYRFKNMAAGSSLVVESLDVSAPGDYILFKGTKYYIKSKLQEAFDKLTITARYNLEFSFVSDDKFNNKGFKINFSTGCKFKDEIIKFGKSKMITAPENEVFDSKLSTVTSKTVTCMQASVFSSGVKTYVKKCEFAYSVLDVSPKYRGRSYDIGDTVPYTCPLGEMPSSDAMYRCTLAGFIKKGYCIKKTCSMAGIKAPMVASDISNKPISVINLYMYVYFSCSPSSVYRLIGRSMLYCRSDGKLNYDLPRCELRGCMVPRSYGMTEYWDKEGMMIEVGQSVKFKCRGTYEPVNEHTKLTCQDYSGVTTIQNGPATCQSVNVCKRDKPCGKHGCTNLSGSFRCNCMNGYEPTDHGKKCKNIDECSKKKKSFLNPYCQECHDTEGDYYCTCEGGYQIYNSNLTAYAMSIFGSGRHDLKFNKSCIKRACDYFMPQNATWSTSMPSAVTSRLYDRKMNYICDNGYHIDNMYKKTATCERKSSTDEMYWDDYEPCKLGMCPGSFEIRHGTLTIANRSYSDEAMVECDGGYMVQGSGRYRCAQFRKGNGKVSFAWTGSSSCKPRDKCPNLSKPVNGDIVIRGNIARYTCKEGFSPNGNPYRICINGMWTGQPITCDPLTCKFPDTGRNVIVSSSMPEAISYKCGGKGYKLMGSRTLNCSQKDVWVDRTNMTWNTAYLCNDNVYQLGCPANTVIFPVYAIYGYNFMQPDRCMNTAGYPRESCGNAKMSLKVVEKQCKGVRVCSIPVTGETFNTSQLTTCGGKTHNLDVTYMCLPAETKMPMTKAFLACDGIIPGLMEAMLMKTSKDLKYYNSSVCDERMREDLLGCMYLKAQILESHVDILYYLFYQDVIPEVCPAVKAMKGTDCLSCFDLLKNQTVRDLCSPNLKDCLMKKCWKSGKVKEIYMKEFEIHCNAYTYISKSAEKNLLLSEMFAPRMDGEMMLRKYEIYDKASMKYMEFKFSGDLAEEAMILSNYTMYRLTFKFLRAINVSTFYLQWSETGMLMNISLNSSYYSGGKLLMSSDHKMEYVRGDVISITPKMHEMSSFMLQFMLSDRMYDMDTRLRISVNYTAPKKVAVIKCFQCEEEENEEECMTQIDCFTDKSTCYSKWFMKGNKPMVNKGCKLKKELMEMKSNNTCYDMSDDKNVKCVSSCEYSFCNAYGICPPWVKSCKYGMNREEFSFNISATTSGFTGPIAQCQTEISDFLFVHVKKMYNAFLNNSCNLTTSTISQQYMSDKKSTYVTVKIVRRYTNLQSIMCQIGHSSGSAVFEQLEASWETFKDKKLCNDKIMLDSMKKQVVHYCSFYSKFCLEKGWCTDMDYISPEHNVLVTKNSSVSIVSSTGKSIEYDSKGFFMIKKAGIYELNVTFVRYVFVKRWSIFVLGSGYKIEDITKGGPTAMAYGSRIIGKMGFAATSFTVKFNITGGKDFGEVMIFFGAEIQKNMTYAICYSCMNVMAESDCTKSVYCPMLSHKCFTTWNMTGNSTTITKGCAMSEDVKEMEKKSMCDHAMMNKTEWSHSENNTSMTCSSSCMYDYCNGLSRCPLWEKTCMPGMSYDKFTKTLNVYSKISSNSCRTTLYTQVTNIMQDVMKTLGSSICGGTVMKMRGVNDGNAIESTIEIDFLYYSYKSSKCEAEKIPMFNNMFWEKIVVHSPITIPSCARSSTVKYSLGTKQISRCSFGAMKKGGICMDPGVMMMMENGIYNSSITSSVSISESKMGMINLTEPGYITVMSNKTYTGMIMFKENVNISRFVLKLFGRGMGLFCNATSVQKQFQFYKVLNKQNFWMMSNKKLEFHFYVAGVMSDSMGFLTIGLEAEEAPSSSSSSSTTIGHSRRRKRSASESMTLELTPKTVAMNFNYTAIMVNATPTETSFSSESFWNGIVPRCIDMEAPKPKSAKDCKSPLVFIERPTIPTRYPIYVSSFWPEFTDNSGESVSITILHPPGLTRASRVAPNSSTSVVFQAEDMSQNKFQCTVMLMWKDDTPPTLTCPPSMDQNHISSSNSTMAALTYGNAIAEDASGIRSISYSPPNGTIIHLLQAQTVDVIATDNNGLTATCRFSQTIIDNTCGVNNVPVVSRTNLSIVLSGIEYRFGCAEGYVLGYTMISQGIAFCGGGQYRITTTKLSSFTYIPPCLKVTGYFDMKYSFQLKMKENSCCKAGVKADVVGLIKKYARCLSNTTMDLKAMLKSTPSGVNPLYCDMELDLTLLYDNSVSKNETLTNCSREIQMVLSEKLLNFSSSNHHCAMQSNISTNPVIRGSYCPSGYFQSPSSVILCVPCTKGLFLNSTTMTCEVCDYDTYQDMDAQSMCKPCPPDYGTLKRNSISKQSCVPKCRRGEYRGDNRQLQPCEVCPIGSYSDKVGATSCTNCTGTNTTASRGSTSMNDCREKCLPGHYSRRGGLAPCEPCPKGQYLNETGQMFCLDCPTNSTSYVVGSTNCTETLACDYLQPCRNGGTCADQPNFEYECICIPGYTGRHCQTMIDMCSSSPCLFGNCTTLLNNYSCTCMDGYFGKNCEIRDFCLNDPCMNNATCVNLNGIYQCENCSEPFTGYNCDQLMNPCETSETNPCLNLGNCSSMANSTSYMCTCKNPYTGPNCETMMDFCSPMPCKNGGICANESDTYSCNCSMGWMGKDCEIDVDECNTTEIRCLNNGTCVNVDGGYSCTCATGYEGFNCSQMIDTCLSNPCHPTANCSSNGIDYTCTCAPGYEGPQCKQEINLCDKNPCHMNGTSNCVPSLNDFTCFCEQGFEGRICNETISYCTPNPCMSGVRCIEGSDVQVIYNQSYDTMFYCMCPWYREGKRCEMQADTCKDNKCANNATCMNGTTNYTCECMHGYNGTHCENVIDLCNLDKRCDNGGTCINEPGSYLCQCAMGWTGQNCTDMVDNCQRKPCMNDGNCTNLFNDFSCMCTDLYEGKTCSDRIEVCLTLPCRNGGSCYDNDSLASGFECVCPPGFEGDLCETNIDDCPKPNPCENGAVCMDMINDYVCQCPSPVYEGKHCNKTKSGDYDFLFDKITLGLMDMLTESINLSVDMKEMSVQYWVRSFLPVDAMFIKIYSSMGTLVEFSTKSVTYYVGGTAKTMTFTLVDGAWTSILVNVHMDMMTLYINGVNVSQLAMPSFSVQNSSYSVSFGNVGNSNNQFAGQITKFFWSNVSITAVEMENLKGNCSNMNDPTPSMNITLDWRMIASGKNNSIPTQCGLDMCPAGLSRPTCATGEDNIPPKIVNCSADITIVEDVDLREITFPEPIFSDDVGIIDIVKSGINQRDKLRPGEYQVIRTAVDLAGNEATCQFKVTFVKFKCEALTPPNDQTSLVCSSTESGEMYCQVSCKDQLRYAIPLSKSTFYSCTAESGGWTPRDSDSFSVSECVLHVPSTSTPQGSMDVSLPAGATCSARRESIITSFLNYMISLRFVYPSVCKKADCSDLRGTVAVNCPAARRRKRSTNPSVTFSLPPGGTSSTDMCRALSSGNSTGGTAGVGVTANSCPTSNPTCNAGYFLSDGICYACPKGTYMRNIYDTACTPCPKGYYTTLTAQTKCDKCPGNETTPGVGATSTELCYEVCPAGQFLNPDTGVCALCPSGTYQSLPGQAQCSVCRSGETSSNGSVTCTSCRAGEQLNAVGACVPCPKGFYRPDNATNFVCAECPFSYTTSGTGATRVSDCSIPICKAGEFLTSNNVCAKCYIGTYQPNRGQTMCIRCPKGKTTNSTASMSESACHPGAVNECMIGSHNCHSHATCMDTADSFECTCNAPKWAGNGVTCSCGSGYSGPNCDVQPAPPTDNSQVIGIAVGCSFAALVIIIVIAIVWYRCYYVKSKTPGSAVDGYANESYDLTGDNPVYDPVVVRQMPE